MKRIRSSLRLLVGSIAAGITRAAFNCNPSLFILNHLKPPTTFLPIWERGKCWHDPHP
jgi:hypothetical protein